MKAKAELIGGPYDGLVIDFLGPSIFEKDGQLQAVKVTKDVPLYFAKRAPDLSGPTVGRRYVYAPMVLRQKA